jgi:hypothetical protein
MHRHLSNIDCLSLVVPTTSATRNRLLSFLFLMRPFTVLVKQTRQAVCAVKQSVFLRCLCSDGDGMLPTLTANISAAVTNRSNIDEKKAASDTNQAI